MDVTSLTDAEARDPNSEEEDMMMLRLKWPKQAVQCLYCGSVLKSIENGKNHYRSFHKRTCRPCRPMTKIIWDNTVMEQHFLRAHLEKDRTCHHCGKIWASAKESRIHNHFVLECSFCGKRFMNNRPKKNCHKEERALQKQVG